MNQGEHVSFFAGLGEVDTMLHPVLTQRWTSPLSIQAQVLLELIQYTWLLVADSAL